MIEETNEDFGRDDRNFHPEEQQIIWETIENKEPAINQDQIYSSGTIDGNYHEETDSEKESDNNNSNNQDIELDKELRDYPDEDLDKEGKSDFAN